VQRQRRRGGDPRLLDLAERGLQARPVESLAVRLQRGGGCRWIVGQLGGRGVLAGAPALDEGTGRVLGRLTGERPVGDEYAGEDNGHESEESGDASGHGF